MASIPSANSLLARREFYRIRAGSDASSSSAGSWDQGPSERFPPPPTPDLPSATTEKRWWDRYFFSAGTTHIVTAQHQV
ncbi:pancreatic progenitor cell differentiation and proliferation factor-like [Petromyzon marinus]|uniref:pancreatic progenitor cell differentiation and proliferation factor-like n=1 Tax=Petromyzon marinus TaxID=7757 RepID=UPI003F71BC61